VAGRNRTDFVFVTSGGALFAAGLLLSAGEIAPFFSGGANEAQRFGAVVAGTYEPGTSLFSKNLFFSDCMSIPDSLFAKAQPTKRRQSFSQKCYDAARVATATMPTYADAWLVLADTALSLGDLDGFRSGLTASQRVAPDVHWLGEQRVVLAAENADKLDDPARAAYRLDLAALFGSPGGAKVLATRYLSHQEEQELILQIGETMPANIQRRFLGAVRDLKSRQGAR